MLTILLLFHAYFIQSLAYLAVVCLLHSRIFRFEFLLFSATATHPIVDVAHTHTHFSFVLCTIFFFVALSQKHIYSQVGEWVVRSRRQNESSISSRWDDAGLWFYVLFLTWWGIFFLFDNILFFFIHFICIVFLFIIYKDCRCCSRH